MDFFPKPRKVHKTAGEILEITFYYHEHLKLLDGRSLVEKVLIKKITAVTIAQMIKLKKSNPIFLSTEFIENLKPKETAKVWAVMILAPSTKIIRIIPTKSPMVKKVLVEYSQSDPDMLQELGVVFMRNKLKTIYNTGICMMHDPPCKPYEGYIESCDLKISDYQLKQELLKIKYVRNVEITKLTI